jgi:hypothetical protein
LILKNQKFEDEFLEAEEHPYLDGEIKFLIEYSGGENDFNVDNFNKYFEIFEKLWDFADKETNKQTLIHRALTTFDDYLPQHNSNKYTFCSFDKGLREKNENWRKVFIKPSFRQLLDEIKSIDNIETKLKKIIDSYEFNCKDFRSYYINPKKDWSPIEYAKNYQIEFKNSNEIFLNRGGTSPTQWGWYKVYEFYSIYLMKLLKEKEKEIKEKEIKEKETKPEPFLEPFKDVKPWSSSNIDESYPCVYLDNWQYNSHNFAIDIKFKDEKFSIEFFDRKGEIDKIDDNLKKILKENGFQLQEEGYINNNYGLCSIDDLIPFVEKICKEFRGLDNSSDI